MSECYVGEIRMFSGNYAPSGWCICDGQLLSINQYDLLYSLIHTTYGGNGSTTFAVPDLRGRVPIHTSKLHPLGEKGGTETVTLLQSEMPSHTHPAIAQDKAGTLPDPTNAVWAAAANKNYTAVTSNLVNMNSASITPAGASGKHENMMPFLALNFIIATEGLYPVQP